MPVVGVLLGKCQGAAVMWLLQRGAARAGEEDEGSLGSFSCVSATGSGSPAQLLLPWEV